MNKLILEITWSKIERSANGKLSAEDVQVSLAGTYTNSVIKVKKLGREDMSDAYLERQKEIEATMAEAVPEKKWIVRSVRKTREQFPAIWEGHREDRACMKIVYMNGILVVFDSQGNIYHQMSIRAEASGAMTTAEMQRHLNDKIRFL